MLLCGTNDEKLKIELLSQWKLEAEFRKNSEICLFSEEKSLFPTMAGRCSFRQIHPGFNLFHDLSTQFMCPVSNIKQIVFKIEKIYLLF